MQPTAMPSKPESGKDRHPAAHIVPKRWWPRLLATAACSLAAAQAPAAPVTIAYTGAFQTFTVQTTGTYTISAGGAQGGGTTSRPDFGGLGAQVFGDFWLTAGTVLDIVVGGSPFAQSETGGGGGGSFVYTQLNELLLAAGGGGGASFNSAGRAGEAGNAGTAGVTLYNGGGAGGNAGQGGGAPSGFGDDGGGGAGWLSNGAAGIGINRGSGGQGRANGFAGGAGAAPALAGGFGGGGGAGFNGGGGGGGGYSGGGGGSVMAAGGGGGSFVADVAEHTGGVSGVRAGNGYVSFDLLFAAADPNAVAEPGSLLLAASALGALALLRRRPA